MNEPRARHPRYQTTDDVIRRAGIDPQANWAAHYAARAAEDEAAAQDAWAQRRTPLTTNQHILHLLITVFTCGLWAPVWIYLAARGNRR
jgi:hypothetical protein